MIPLNNLQARPEGETDIFSTRRRIKISWWWFMLILCPTLVPERTISFSVQRPNQKFFFSCYHSTYWNFCWSQRYARSVIHVKLATTLRLNKKCLKRSQYSTGGGASEGEIRNIWNWIISFSKGISLSTLEKSIFGNIFKMFPSPFHNLHWRNVSSILPFNAQDFISNSPHCLPYSSYDASSENLVLDQLENPQTYIFLYSHHLSVWYCIDIVLILYWYCICIVFIL